MSRLQRIKDAIASTVAKMQADIEKSHKEGKIPADYSLGFTNGMIFADHHINMRDGQPKFFERTTSIGALPKPVVLHSGNALKDEQTFQFLQDDVILKARLVAAHGESAIEDLRKSLNTMESFVTEQLEATTG